MQIPMRFEHDDLSLEHSDPSSMYRAHSPDQTRIVIWPDNYKSQPVSDSQS